MGNYECYAGLVLVELYWVFWVGWDFPLNCREFFQIDDQPSKFHLKNPPQSFISKTQKSCSITFNNPPARVQNSKFKRNNSEEKIEYHDRL
jgi:hypothetical protein